MFIKIIFEVINQSNKSVNLSITGLVHLLIGETILRTDGLTRAPLPPYTL